MGVTYQITVDCRKPDTLVHFWAEALGYQPEAPPPGFSGWGDYWRSVGVPEDEADDTPDSLIDPAGHGPRIWFQIVPESKTVKNRIHLDVRASGPRGAPRGERIDAILDKVATLEAFGATKIRVIEQAGLDHFAVVMSDPEGNEFCVN